jgi:hypothetical protein
VSVAVQVVERVELRDVVARERTARMARHVDAFPGREIAEEIGEQFDVLRFERAHVVRGAALTFAQRCDTRFQFGQQAFFAFDDRVHSAPPTANSGTALSSGRVPLRSTA